VVGALLYLPDPGSRSLASRVVAGRSLLVRALVAALRGGAAVIGVPATLKEAGVDRAVSHLPALAQAIRWLEPGRALDEPFSNGLCLLLPAAVLLETRSVQLLLASPAPPRGACLAASAASGAPLLVAPASLVAALWKSLGAGDPVGRELARYVEDCRPELRDGAALFEPIRSETDRRRAEERLFRMLGTSLDGWVDEQLNRRCSRWLTRLLVRTSATPNQVSLASLAVGSGAIWACWQATPESAAWTVVLYALASIIDHSDGEVARLTFQESTFGAHLDWSIDTLIHTALVLGIGVTAGGRLGLTVGILGAIGVLLSAIMARHLPQEPGVGATVGGVLRNLGNRDFFYLLLVAFAVFRWLAPPLLAGLAVLIAAGSQLYWIGCVARITAARRTATG